MDARDSFRSFISRGRSLSLAPMLVLCAAMAGCSDRTVETVPGGVVPDGGIDAGGSPFEFADKHIHFDLSPHIAHGDTFIAHVARQHRPVKPHTNETRAALRRAQPALAAVPDESLTHYIDGVTLPSDRAALVWVTQHHPVDGPGLALTGIYIPPASMQKARMAKARQGWPRYAHLLAAPPPADGGTDATADIMHAKPIEIAKAVLFHHPELMRLDADTAAQTMVHIESAGGLHDLSLAISRQGQAHVHTAGKQDGWAVLKPINLPDGTQKIDGNGKPMFKYTISDKTVAAAGAALKYALRSSKDDPDLRNVTYSVQDGNGPINATPVATLRLAEAASPYRLDLSEAHDKSGLDVKVENLSTATDRKIKATFTNHWLRHLGLYVQFLDADRNPLDIANPGDSYIDDPTYRAKYLGQLFPVLTIMGIPLSAEDQEFEVDIPDEATYVRFLAGGFGTSQYKWSKTMKWGGLTTGIFEYGLPCLFLAAATGLNETASLKAIMHDGELLFAAVAIGGFLFAPFEGGAIASEGTTREVLGSFADFIADMLWHAGMEKLGEWVVEKLTEEELEQAVPFAGWAIKALTIAPTVAALVETTAEVLSSPVAIDNTVATLMKTTVTLHPDPTHGAFPQTATHYKVTASFSHNTSQKVEDTVPATSALKRCANDVPCIDVTFPNVPVGGQVMFTVGFYSKTGWLAGKAETAWMDNLIPAGKDEFALDVTIKEMLVPLTIDTTYSHKQKLAYVNGKYAWEATGAPAATFADRSCDNVGGNLCQPYKITYSDPDGTTQFIPFIGYAWQSAGPSQADCVSGQANTQSYFIQSISDNPDPDEHVLTVPCGFTSPMHIVYDVVHPDRKYFIDPRNGQFNLRKLDVGAADWSLGSFAGKSWGRFTQPFDAVALHPDGRHMVGANWANSKLEVLEIPDSSSPDASAPIATPISGMGIREGLMHGPRAMAFAPDGTLLVLEDINARIQAFDLGGNPAPLFTATAAKYWAPLKAQTAPVTYLDLGVENTGFMYVLYYLHDGSLTSDYHVDIYRADGMHLAATQGVAAARLTVDLWRNMFTLNWEKILGRNNRVEPSVSEWIPSTPSQP